MFCTRKGNERHGFCVILAELLKYSYTLGFVGMMYFPLLAFLICQITSSFTSTQAEESFILEELRGYPMFHEEEIRGRRTMGNILRSMGADDDADVDVGRFDSYWDSSARKKSETFFTNEQVNNKP